MPQDELPNDRCNPADGRCGMHPDGNVPGTLGCTGITSQDSTTIKDLVNDFESSPDNPLDVVVY